jgi:hypothetical protein
MFEAVKLMFSVGMKGRKGAQERYKFVEELHFDSTCYGRVQENKRRRACASIGERW